MIDIKEIEIFQRVGKTPFYSSSAIVDNWISLIINDNYQKWNEFELQVNYSLLNMQLFLTDNLLRLGNVYYYITSVQVDKIETGVLVKGRSLFGRVSDRMIMAENGNYYNQYPEQIARALLDSEVVKPSDTKRTIYSLFNPDTTIFSTSKITMQQGYAQLDDVLTNLMSTYDFGVKEEGGFYSTTDITQSVIFYRGRDLSDTVEISTQLQNLINPSFTNDKRDEKTFALIAGEGDYPNRVKQAIGGELTDIDRKELYVDARDVQKTSNNVTMSDADYKAALIARGCSKLTETQRLLTLEGEIDFNSKLFELGKDFDVGDRITISSRDFNLSKSSLIVGAKYTFDKDGRHVDLTFDKDTDPKIIFN